MTVPLAAAVRSTAPLPHPLEVRPYILDGAERPGAAGGGAGAGEPNGVR